MPGVGPRRVHKFFEMPLLALGRPPLRHVFCLMTESHSDKAVAISWGEGGAFRYGHAWVLTPHLSLPSLYHHHGTAHKASDVSSLPFFIMESSSSTQGAKALLRGTVTALVLSTSLAFVVPSSQSLRPAAPASSHRGTCCVCVCRVSRREGGKAHQRTHIRESGDKQRAQANSHMLPPLLPWHHSGSSAGRGHRAPCRRPPRPGCQARLGGRVSTQAVSQLKERDREMTHDTCVFVL